MKIHLAPTYAGQPDAVRACESCNCSARGRSLLSLRAACPQAAGQERCDLRVGVRGGVSARAPFTGEKTQNSQHPLVILAEPLTLGFTYAITYANRYENRNRTQNREPVTNTGDLLQIEFLAQRLYS